jgi:2-keto-4-pentenoate hydratase/2-oxohepta-3-ene-1,7-dioic acid hydratase in catechol pathway
MPQLLRMGGRLYPASLCPSCECKGQLDKRHSSAAAIGMGYCLMRVTSVKTDDGPRLAIVKANGTAVVDAPGAPNSVNDLVRGGDEARRQAERAVEDTHLMARPELAGLCIPWPNKIICIGLNYRRHAAEARMKVTETPMMFSKFHNTLAAAGEAVRLPLNAEKYDYEAELGVVIGRRAFRVSEATALDYVWGYCNANDLSARDLQMRTSQVMLGKTLDGFLPVGPALVSADEAGDPQNLTIRAWLNGEIRQDSNTSDMIFSVSELVSYLSNYIALEVGDFIATGTPEGVILGREPQIWMKPGDIVEVEVQGLGRLATHLVTGE